MPFFYFRDPTASGRVAQGQDAIDKQKALKERILQSGFPVRENYPNAEAAGRMILEDLKEAIDKEFPDQQMTPLERDDLDHESFAVSRAKVYVGRQHYFDRLDAHATGNGEPLVVLGESGAGKSALLANWCFHFREKHPDTFLLMHFVGSSRESSDYAALLRRIMGEIKKRYALTNDLPATPEELRAQFPDWLSMAAAHGRFVLVIDAVNQLEDKDNALDLTWLPEFIPSGVRLAVSTLPGRSLDEVKKRNWPQMKVELLEPQERRKLIQKYLLELYSKRLPQDVVEHIAVKEQCANPLYLHALLEELRIFGQHEELRARIDHYLRASDPQELYELVLTRLEEDYEKDRPGLVGEALTLIWTARRGLSETELLEIMEIPPLVWSPLSLALQDSLVSRSGLLTFFHTHFRAAVHTKYIRTSESEKAARLRLADYFEQGDDTRRKIEELPWQLEKAFEWERLQTLLQALPFLQKMWSWDWIEVVTVWTRLMKETDCRIASSYSSILSKLPDYEAYHEILYGLFFQLAHYDESLMIAQAQVAAFSNADGSVTIFDRACGRSYQNVGKTHEELGDYDAALENYEKAREIFQTISDRKQVAIINTLIGVIHLHGKRYEQAQAYLTEALNDFSSLYGSDNSYTAGVFVNLAALFEKTGQIDQSIESNERALSIMEKTVGKNHPAISNIYQGLGTAYYAAKDYESAISCFQSALKVVEKTFGPRTPPVQLFLSVISVMPTVFRRTTACP
jgi:nephrocystin-3